MFLNFRGEVEKKGERGAWGAGGGCTYVFHATIITPLTMGPREDGFHKGRGGVYCYLAFPGMCHVF